MKKHAYLILAHDNFKVLKYALSMIDDERNVIFLLIDKKTKNYDVNDLTFVMKNSPLIILPRIAVNWAGYSMIEAVIRLLDSANKYQDHFSYYHFMQGADLPLKSQNHIHDYFDQMQGREFIDFNPKNYEFAKYKKCYYHFFVDNRFFRDYKVVKFANHFPARIQKALGLKRRYNCEPYHGSALFSITNEFAQYVLESEEIIKNEYSYTLGCEEVFLQTLIMNSHFKSRLNDFEKPCTGNSRLIDFTKSTRKNSPYTFTINDYELLIGAGEEICFARKFHGSVDMKIVEALHYKIKCFRLE